MFFYRINNNHYIEGDGYFYISIFLGEPLTLVAQLEYFDNELHDIRLLSEIEPTFVVTHLRAISTITSVLGQYGFSKAEVIHKLESNNIRNYEDVVNGLSKRNYP